MTRTDVGRVVARRALVVVVAAALGAAATASGHGGAAPKGFISTVTEIRPEIPGLKATIVGGDDELRLENRSRRIVIIEGYDGEPYVRLGPDGVYQNFRSPAVWTSKARMWGTPVPLTTDPTAAPEWRRTADEPVFQWHDHRSHWMNFVLPPRALRRPDEAYRVFNWTVPGTVDGRRLVIAGTLDYAPGGTDSEFPWGLVVAIATAVVIVLVGALLFVARRRDSATAEALR